MFVVKLAEAVDVDITLDANNLDINKLTGAIDATDVTLDAN